MLVPAEVPCPAVSSSHPAATDGAADRGPFASVRRRAASRLERPGRRLDVAPQRRHVHRSAPMRAPERRRDAGGCTFRRPTCSTTTIVTTRGSARADDGRLLRQPALQNGHCVWDRASSRPAVPSATVFGRVPRAASPPCPDGAGAPRAHAVLAGHAGRGVAGAVGAVGPGGMAFNHVFGSETYRLRVTIVDRRRPGARRSPDGAGGPAGGSVGRVVAAPSSGATGRTAAAAPPPGGARRARMPRATRARGSTVVLVSGPRGAVVESPVGRRGCT